MKFNFVKAGRSNWSLAWFLAVLVMAGLASTSRAQEYHGLTLVTPRLIANADAIVPGQPITLGLELDTAPGWHTYWQYPGDAGLATQLAWALPPGFTAGPIQWPLPVRDNEPGDIVTYDYGGKTLLPVQVQAPADLKPGQNVELKAHAVWLVCKNLCVPGKADLSISLPVAATSQPANAAAFDAARSLMPRTGQPPFSTSWARDGQTLKLTVSGLPVGDSNFDFYPLPGDVQIDHPVIKPPTVTIPLTDPQEKAGSIDGVVILKTATGQESWQLSTATGANGTTGGATGATAMPGSSLWVWLLLGVLGGLALNIMPCVLPVIGLKLAGFVHQAGESPRRIKLLGFTFVAGIFAWFLLLAGLIVGFRAAGSSLNWAFQFQSPIFVAVMAVIVLVFALNMLGVFEIALPGRLQNAVGEASGKEGYAGTFLHGAFATLMATPCTGPFLGSALGFALAQPGPVVFAMFGSFAAGMSAPYAVLAMKPGWLKFLPKPGLWMVRVKQAFGIMLLACLIWLGSIFYTETFAPRPKAFPPQLAAALAQHKIVFVDFTATWCLNCKYYERTVINSAAVQHAFKDRGVIVLKADWTNGDADITALLQKFGRAGVPCYVVYKPDGNPIVLPDVINQQIVLNALSQA